MYGISRIDDDVYRTHAWRVSLRRHGKALVRNFADKKCGGKRKALQMAKLYRDQLLASHPPMSRKEFAEIRRRNNNTGITGVYKYAKKYLLKDGRERATWYWEANWPTVRGESANANFSINEYGEAVAKQLAIRAREEGLKKLKGVFWASERGLTEETEGTATPKKRVAAKSKTAATSKTTSTAKKKAAATKAKAKAAPKTKAAATKAKAKAAPKTKAAATKAKARAAPKTKAAATKTKAAATKAKAKAAPKTKAAATKTKAAATKAKAKTAPKTKAAAAKTKAKATPKTKAAATKAKAKAAPKTKAAAKKKTTAKQS